jgi:hypothetical protein
VAVDAAAVTDAVREAIERASAVAAEQQLQSLGARASTDIDAVTSAASAAARAETAARQARDVALDAADLAKRHAGELARLRSAADHTRHAISHQIGRHELEWSDNDPLPLDPKELERAKKDAVTEVVRRAAKEVGSERAKSQRGNATASPQGSPATTKLDAVADKAALGKLAADVAQEQRSKASQTNKAVAEARKERQQLEQAEELRAREQQRFQQTMSALGQQQSNKLRAQLAAAALQEELANQRRLKAEQEEKQALQRQITATAEAGQKDSKLREAGQKEQARISEQDEKDTREAERAEGAAKSLRKQEEEMKRKAREDRTKEESKKLEMQQESAGKRAEAERLAAEKAREVSQKKHAEDKAKEAETQARRKEEIEKESKVKSEEQAEKTEHRTKAEAQRKAEEKRKEEERVEQQQKENLAAAQRKEATEKAEAKAEAETKQEQAQKTEATHKAQEQASKEQQQKAEETAKAEAKLQAQVAAEQGQKKESTSKAEIKEQAEKAQEKNQKAEQKAKEEQAAKQAAAAAAKAKEEADKRAEQQGKVEAKAEADSKARQEQAKKEEAKKAAEAEATKKAEEARKNAERVAEAKSKAAAKEEADAKARQKALELAAKKEAEGAAKTKEEQASKAEAAEKKEAQRKRELEEQQAKTEAKRKAEEARVKKGTQLDLADGVEVYGHEYGNPQYIRKGPLCFLTGMAHYKSFANGFRLAVLPPECRPSGRLVFDQHIARVATARTDVTKEGEVLIVVAANPQESGWFSFDKIFFIVAGVDSVQDVRLSGYFANYGDEYYDAVWLRHGDFCVVQGLLRTRSGWGNPVATLPHECRPMDGRLIFNLNHHQYSGRVDVLREGEIHYVQNWGSYNWISLAGIGFYVESASNALELAGGFGRYGNGYRAPSWQKDDSNVCAVSGLLTYSGYGPVATLPLECRPKHRLVFSTNLHQYSERVDVLPSGQIVWVGGTMAHGWLSLDGLVFVTDARVYAGPRLESHKMQTKALALGSSWTPFGPGYRAPQFTVFGQLCLLSGIARTRNMRSPLATLSEPCIPTTNRSRSAWDRHVLGTETARVDIGGAEDDIRWAAGSQNGNWLSLDGMIFPVKGARLTSLALEAPYEPFKGSFEAPSYFLQEGLCVLQGTVREKNGNVIPGGVIGHVPDECVPRGGHLIFLVSHNQYTNVVYLFTDGRLIWQGGTREHSWLALSGIAFHAESSANFLALRGGWTPYQSGYRVPLWRRQGDVCILSGLAGSNGNAWVADLPATCRPRERLVFFTSHYYWAARLDVLPDGRVLYVEGGRNWGWVSLDGIRFVADVREDVVFVRQNMTQASDVQVKFADGVNAAGRGYAQPAFSRTGALCLGRGVSSQGSMTRQLAQLPDSCRPAGDTSSFKAPLAAGEMARFDIDTHGVLRWRSGGSRGTWVSYSSFVFPVRGTPLYPISLQYLWMPKDVNHPPSYVLQGSFCLLSGAAVPEPLNPQWASHLTNLPAQCRPLDGRLVFTFLNDDRFLRYDILQDGSVHHVATSAAPTFLSLDGVGFFVHTTTSPLTLFNSWSPYSSAESGGVAHGGYRVPSFRKEGSLCALSGLASGNGGTHMATLPRECRPDGALIFHANQHQYMSLIVVNSTGVVLFEPRDNVIVEGGGRYKGWVSLDGIYWTVSSFEQATSEDDESALDTRNCTEGVSLQLLNGFRPYHYGGDAFRPPIYSRVGQIVLLSGTATASDIKRTLGVLPTGARPAARLGFDVHGEGTAMFRMDVLSNGEVKWVRGSSSGSWIALDSIVFAVNGSSFFPIQLLGRYVNMGQGFADASFFVQDEICVLQGTVRDRFWEHARDHIGVLPSECRPREGQLIFRVNALMDSPRVDVGTNGWLYYQWGHSYQNDYRCLDGIAFFVVSNRQLRLVNGYGAYGSGYRAPSYNKQDNICMLSGLASGSFMGTLTVVPEECRPRERLIFTMANHNYYPRFDLLPDGRLLSVFHRVQHGWVSLDMIRYVVPAKQEAFRPAIGRESKVEATELSLGSGIEPYRRGYLTPQAQRFGSLCMLSGLARVGDHRQRWATTPSTCQPERRQVFDQHIEGTRTVRVDVLSSGDVRFVAGSGETTWLSFDGIILPVRGSPTAPIELHNSWTNYGYGYEEANFIKQGDICVVQGFIKPYGVESNSWFTHIGTVPETCWPRDGRLIFNANYNEDTHRVDLAANGELHWVTGSGNTRRYNLLSLSGFVVPTRRGERLPFIGGNWGSYGSGYREPMFATQGDVCYVSGLARGNGHRELALLPETCRPQARLVFHVNHHYYFHRYDVHPSGLIEWVDGTRNWDWISLDGIRFATKPSTQK